jgi:AcrR family transcriptional regulator
LQQADIIQAAAQIFRQKGYHGTSMQDIADAVHLQKASLYYHISGKQEILVSILDHALDLMIDDLETVIARDASPAEQLRQAMISYVSRLTEEADLAAVLLLEHRSLDNRARASHIRRRDRFESLWRSIISRGIERGEFSPQDPRLATFALMGVLNWTITWFSPNGDFSPEQIADLYADLFLHGLQVKRDEVGD